MIGLRARVVGFGMLVRDSGRCGEYVFVSHWQCDSFARVVLADDVLCSEQCDTAPYCQCEV